MMKRYIDGELTRMLREKMRHYWDAWEDEIINGTGQDGPGISPEIRSMMGVKSNDEEMLMNNPIMAWDKGTGESKTHISIVTRGGIILGTKILNRPAISTMPTYHEPIRQFSKIRAAPQSPQNSQDAPAATEPA